MKNKIIIKLILTIVTFLVSGCLTQSFALDNFNVSEGSGKTIASDDISGVMHQRVKISVGADGSGTDLSTANPLPVLSEPQTTSGTLTAVSQSVTLSALKGNGSVAVQLTGTWSATVAFEGTVDGTNWVGINGSNIANGNSNSSVSSNAIWKLRASGLTAVRARCTAYTSGTVAVSMNTTATSDVTSIIDAPVVGADTELPGGVTLADSFANPAIAYLGAFPFVYNGSTWDRIRGNSTGLYSHGNVAHDAVDAGNPIKTGAKAITTLPAAVANLDRTDTVSDLFGRSLNIGANTPEMQVWKSFNATTTQTGTDVWSPTAGKKIAVTRVDVSAYGTTAGRVIVWFGDNADTTYTAGTDQPLFIGSYAPSATIKTNNSVVLPTPVYCTTADREIHITTDAGISVDVVVYGYEF